MTRRYLIRIAVLAACVAITHIPARAQITWNIDNTTNIGGNAVTTVVGSPTVVSTPFGNALKFDGNDGLIVNADPLAGAASFTLEMLFRPDPIVNPGSNQPRILHLQSIPNPPDHRATLEGRISAGQWYLDAFLRSQDAGQSNPNIIESLTLIDPSKLHPLSTWYNFTMSYDGAQLRAYLNGQLELSGPLTVTAMAPGQTSLGMRHNQVNFFEGIIAKVRFTPAIVDPADFMSAVIPGDYDRNGAVNAADYDAWRATLGSPVAVPGDGADGNGNGVIDAADYVLWRDRTTSPATSTSAAAPEPRAIGLLAVAAGICFVSLRFRAAVISAAASPLPAALRLAFCISS